MHGILGDPPCSGALLPAAAFHKAHRQWAAWPSAVCLGCGQSRHQPAVRTLEVAADGWPMLGFSAPHASPISVQPACSVLHLQQSLQQTVAQLLPCRAALLPKGCPRLRAVVIFITGADVVRVDHLHQDRQQVEHGAHSQASQTLDICCSTFAAVQQCQAFRSRRRLRPPCRLSPKTVSTGMFI